MLNIVGIFLAIFLSFILFTKKNKLKADKILSIWFFIVGLHLFLFYLSSIINQYYQPYLLLGASFPLLHGPMLYFYTNALTSQNKISFKEYFLHSLPIVIFYITLTTFIFLPHQEKLLVFTQKGLGYETEKLIRKILIYASGIFYVILSLNLLYKHSKNIQNNFSDTEKINLVWLRYLICSMAIIWLAVFTGNKAFIFSLVAIFVILLGYFGIKQVGIFTQTLSNSPSIENNQSISQIPDTQITSLKFEENEFNTKILKNSLSSSYLSEVHQKLIELVDKEKPFLNPELTIAQLASKISVHPNYLSQAINLLEEKTFYDYINEKRIDEFKKIIFKPENQKYTILALAYNCGFNSKTAFYRNFKNVTGLSPTQYLKQQNIQLEDN
ncbi:hypothetical protein AD998_02670 [bacterium 336/3]|nr:hypothetical protein AD998_02670 [bacterium 336/3]